MTPSPRVFLSLRLLAGRAELDPPPATTPCPEKQGAEPAHRGRSLQLWTGTRLLRPVRSWLDGAVVHGLRELLCRGSLIPLGLGTPCPGLGGELSEQGRSTG